MAAHWKPLVTQAAWTKAAIGLCCLLLVWAAPAQGQESAKNTADPQASEAAIEAWIRQLDSQKFDEREDAAAKLLAAGAAAVEPLTSTIAGASRERLSRSLSILVDLALHGEAEAQLKAEVAVESIARGADPRAARIASGSLGQVHLARRDQAREMLLGLGAIVGEIRMEDINGIWRLDDEVGMVEIGPAFRGSLDDLKLLRRLTDVESITISHPAANDQWLDLVVEKMPQLQEVNLKRAPQITSVGLARLRLLPRLHHVWISYMPVDEKGVEELARLPEVNYLTLFGTGISKQKSDELASALQFSNVDIRTGAFLGLGGADGADGLRVRSVSPGSAADKMGLKINDTLQAVNGQPVASINDLTRILRPIEPGAKIQIEYLSGSEAKKVEVTLGEWP